MGFAEVAREVAGILDKRLAAYNSKLIRIEAEVTETK